MPHTSGNIPYCMLISTVLDVYLAYSPDMDMNNKMLHCGMVNADWLPISVFDF